MYLFDQEDFSEFINLVYRRLFPRKISGTDIEFLDKHFFYYAKLKPPYKKHFIKKLQLVLSTKRFVARGGLEEITNEMELLIGATITMVTFGWKKQRLAHFHTIVVYPNAYYSSINQAYHKGEVNPRHGLIVIGWNYFVEGLEDLSDGVNLGIHEVAHALNLAHFINSDGEREFLPRAWAEYLQWMPAELEKIRSRELTLFRERGGEDEHEFFAVAVETFFEQSHDFHAYHPELYQAMVMLLRQDPRVLLN